MTIPESSLEEGLQYLRKASVMLWPKGGSSRSSGAGVLERGRAFVNGSWTAAAQGRVFPVTNPATGAVITEVADMTVEDAGAAIDGAIAAQAQWRERSGKERAAVLRAWHAKLKENREAIAALITEEQGKPLSEARGEVEFGASFVEWFAEEAKRLYGDLIPGPTGDRRFVVIKQPIGVCAAITPGIFR
ncbi:MAG: aldehyde dehydrogenase family protein [Arhodomonas sp.]|nr:aldehyde dehydrogenase family protein [Arhodomonas sp.]